MRLRERVSRIATRLAEVVVIAGLYVGTAKLGFLLAIAPGNVTAVWPPSGIAFAAILIVGVRAWVGIWLGALLINTLFFATVRTFSVVAITTATGIAVGSTLQALLGAVLLRRFISPDRLPERIGQILGFVGMEMLVCSVAPTMGTASLCVGGYAPLANAAGLWGTWWLGDLAGVLLVASLALLVSQASNRREKPKQEFAFPLLSAGFALSLLACYFMWRLELQTTAANFEKEAKGVVDQLQMQLTTATQQLESIAAFYASSRDVERGEFHSFVQPYLRRHASIQALGWAPRILQTERTAVEEAAAQNGVAGFQITEHDSQGRLVRAATRQEYVPAYFVEPAMGNERMLGFDLASQPAHLDALRQARDTGQAVATAPVRLMRGAGTEEGFLLVWPIYRHGASIETLALRRTHLAGFAVGVFRSGQLIETVLRNRPSRHMLISVVDEEAPDQRAARASSLESAQPGWVVSQPEQHLEVLSGGLRHLASFDVGGRRWKIISQWRPGRVGARGRWKPWAALLAGLTMTLSLALYLAQRKRAELALQATLEQRIAERTHQLLAINQAFQRQITQRKRLEDELHHKAEELLGSNAELTRRERVTQSLLEDLQTSKNSLEQQQRSLQEAHARLQGSHEELQAVQLQLIQAEKLESIGRMAAGVAHEVKNPLAVILMGVAYLSKQLANGNANVPVVLRDMDDAVQRADRVIRGLLDFSAPSELQFNTEDLNAVIEQAFMLVKHEFTRSHVTVIKDLAASLPPVNLDGNKIQQAFINLFINAVHAMPDGGTLTVRTSVRPLAQVRHALSPKNLSRFVRVDTVIVMEIEDTGSGIPEGKLDKVFDPFFTTKPTGKGTGLGLTVTEKIVELHGGVIDIRNRAEGGVRATLVFA